MLKRQETVSGKAGEYRMEVGARLHDSSWQGRHSSTEP